MKPCIKCGELWNEDAFKDGGNVCPDCIRRYQREWYRSSTREFKQRKADRCNASLHANSTSALADAPHRRECAKCHIVKGKKSYAADSAICRRCSHA